jgi:hypothetical protein
VWIACCGVLLPGIVDQALYASTVRFSTRFFDMSDLDGTLMHLLGMFDIVEYVYAKSSPALWQYAGGLLVAFCFTRLRRSSPVLPAIAITIVFGAYLLFVRAQEYQANRMLAIAWALAPPVLFGWIRGSRELGIGAVTTLLLLTSVLPLSSRAAQSPITTSQTEREMGRWLAAIPDNAKVLIDVPDDTQIWYLHWMYQEALHRFRGDDSKLAIMSVALSYIATVKPDETDLTGVTHILRRNMPGQVQADATPVAQNSKYRLLRVNRALFWYWTKGFHGVEPSGAGWVQQDGTLIIQADRAGERTLLMPIWANPALGSTKLTLFVNGAMSATVEATQLPMLQLVKLPLQAGRNEIVLHSEREPIPPGNGDGRLLSVSVGPLSFQ